MLRVQGGVRKVACEGNKDLTQGRQSRAIQEKRSKGRCWRRQPLEGRKISGQKRSRRKFEREAMLRRLAETWLRFFFFFFFGARRLYLLFPEFTREPSCRLLRYSTWATRKTGEGATDKTAHTLVDTLGATLVATVIALVQELQPSVTFS